MKDLKFFIKNINILINVLIINKSNSSLVDLTIFFFIFLFLSFSQFHLVNH
jgi:hypothetical protein